MAKFRKKPVVIEAFQMTKEHRADNSNWPAWLHEAWNIPYDTEGAVCAVDFPHSDGTDELEIVTLEGAHRVSFGDWIIRGIKGELYPCKPDIFEATYERADDTPRYRDAVTGEYVTDEYAAANPTTTVKES